MSKSSSKTKRRRKGSYKNITMLAVVLVILGGIYYYVHIYMRDPDVVVDQTIPQAQYTLLENTDSINYLATVMYVNNVNINTISQTFYKSNVFWPYIFVANQNEPSVKSNPLDIPQGVILKIPRIPSNLLDMGNPEAIRKVEALADTILNMKEEVKSSYHTVYNR